MKAFRALLWLLAAATLAMSPAMAAAQPLPQHASSDCADHGQAKKHVVSPCCASVVSCMIADGAEMPREAFRMEALASRTDILIGYLSSKDPPPPRS